MQHFIEVIRLEREEMVRRLVTEDERGDEYRAAIRMADRLLRLPDKMMQDGRESGRLLIGDNNG